MIGFSPGECCNCAPAGVTCSGCSLPLANLTLSWTNVVLGNGSTTLPFDGVSAWQTGCVGGRRYRLDCSGGGATFGATYFSAGVCPTGTPSTCQGPGSSPLGLAVTLLQCSPLLFRWTVTSTNCPSLYGLGFRTFTVTL